MSQFENKDQSEMEKTPKSYIQKSAGTKSKVEDQTPKQNSTPPGNS